METMRKMELQRRARDGLEARDLLAEKFGEAWLKEVEAKTLSRLVNAKGVEELTEVQADYKAAKRFWQSLVSVSNAGKQADARLRDLQREERT